MFLIIIKLFCLKESAPVKRVFPKPNHLHDQIIKHNAGM